MKTYIWSKKYEKQCLVLKVFSENMKTICLVFLLVQLHHAGEGELKPGGKK